MSKKTRKKSSFFYYLWRFIFGTVVVVILTAIIYPFLPSKPQIPCANTISCVKNLSVNIENNAVGIFDNKKVIPPKISLSQKNQPVVLGASTNETGKKHIYVDLTHQTLYAYQGKTLFMQTLISSGKWNPTPTGDFTIWLKVVSTRMTGGEGDDFYDLPNVPYVMFFSNDDVPESDGYSLHGAYWHNNFGHPMSHGCVNMRIVDAQKLYNWTDPITSDDSVYADNQHPGTKVTIYGNAPL